MPSKPRQKINSKGDEAPMTVSPLVKECLMDFLYYDDTPDIDVPGEVKFDAERIVVSYGGEGTFIVYQGIEKGKGHYELRAPVVNGRATLHMFESSKILEGFWVEEYDEARVRGMWRVRLK